MHVHQIDWYKRGVWHRSKVHMQSQGKKKAASVLKRHERKVNCDCRGSYNMTHTQRCDTVFNSLLYGGTAVGLSSHSCSTALLQLSLRNCCRCFCCINLSYPPRKLSNKTIQRGPQRVQNLNIKWQGSEIFFWGGGSMTCFLANLLCGSETESHVENVYKTAELDLPGFRIFCF